MASDSSQKYVTLEEEEDGDSSPTPASKNVPNKEYVGHVDRVIQSQPSSSGSVPISAPPESFVSGLGAATAVPSSVSPHGESATPQIMTPPEYSAVDNIGGLQNIDQPGSLQDQLEEVELPPPYSPPDEANRPPEYFDSVNCLNVSDVRDALVTFVEGKCCYGNTSAHNMEFSDIRPLAALHYKLETFTEKRSMRWQFVPFYGGDIDGPQNGAPPAVWDIVCEPDQMFQSHSKDKEVPHTSTIKPCHKCSGRGQNSCSFCWGSGRVTCGACGGCGSNSVYMNGQLKMQSCHSCVGGSITCTHCHGSGSITCTLCVGSGMLRHFQRLQVTFLNRCSDYIHQGSQIPDEMIRNVAGYPIFEQTLPLVWPITSYAQPEINANSIRIVEQHRNSWPGERILKQHQLLRSVPVSEVGFRWKEHWGQFWVFGQEHKVYFPEYPQKCCCGCTIL